MRPAAIAFLVALAARLAHLWALRSTPWIDLKLGDASTYDAWARRIAGGDWMSGTEVFYQAPLYPYFLALVYAIVGSTPLVVRGVQAIVGSLSCALLAGAGASLVSRRAGLVAGLILALYPPAIFHDLLLQKSVLDVFFTCAALAAFARVVADGGTRTRWLVLGVAIGCLTLTRENAIVLLLPIVAWAVVSRDRRALALALGLALPLAPVAVRNWAVSGEVHLTTSQLGPNLYIGNNPHADGTYRPLVARRARAVYERGDATRLAEEAAGRPLSAGEVSRHYAGLAFDYISGDPAAWLRLEWRKFLLAWNAVEVADTEDQYAHADRSPVLSWLSVPFNMGILAPLAAAGAWVSWPRRRSLWPFHAMVLIYLASLLVFYVFARYRLPMVPLLALFAAAAATGFGAASRDRRGSLPACAAITIAMAIIANWPLVEKDTMRAVTYFNTGVALQRVDRSDEALAHFETAVRLNPQFAEAHNNLGRLLSARGRTEEAARALEQAIALAPDFTLARQNLADVEHYRGLMLAKQDRLDEAIVHFERAVALGKPTPRMHLNLGVAFARKGAFDRAADQFRRALQLDPSNGEARANLERLR